MADTSLYAAVRAAKSQPIALLEAADALGKLSRELKDAASLIWVLSTSDELDEIMRASTRAIGELIERYSNEADQMCEACYASPTPQG